MMSDLLLALPPEAEKEYDKTDQNGGTKTSSNCTANDGPIVRATTSIAA
jgi:hypothetical protein